MSLNTIEYLYNEIGIADNLLLDTYSEQERIALLDYICDIKYIISRVLNKREYSLEELDDNEDSILLLDYLSLCKEEMTKTYIGDRPFHQSFLFRVFRYQDTLLTDKELGKIKEHFPQISKEEFFDILHGFMSSINQERIFERQISENRIIIQNDKANDYGFCVHNPITNDSTILVKDRGYNISSLVTAAHEFGHVYDFDNFEGSIANFNYYINRTFNKEVVSKLVERLMFDYLIENNIHKKEAQARLLKSSEDDMISTLNAYIMSLINVRDLYDAQYKYLSRKQVLSQIQSRFSNPEDINAHLKKELHCLDLEGNNTYAYGSVLALLLKDSVKEDGFESPLLKEFLTTRTNPTCREFLESTGLTTDYYGQCLEKEVQLIKK